MGARRPRRRPWRRHPFAAATLALLALVLIVRLVWGYAVHRSLEAQIKVIRARGEPVTSADFVIAELPDSANAAVTYRKAFAAINANVDSPRMSNIEYPDYPPYSHRWMRMAAASERANAKAFELARQARRQPAAVWRQAPPTIANVFNVNLNKARQLANALADSAMYAHVNGDDARAIERTKDLLHLSRAIRADDMLISQLVAIGIDALACHNMQIMAPGMRFDAGSTTRPATREQVRELIAALLDEDAAWRGVEDSIGFERMILTDFRATQAKGTWFMRPVADAQTRRDLWNMEVAAEASRLRTKPQVTAVLARLRTEEMPERGMLFGTTRPPAIPRHSRWFAFASNPARYLETNFRIMSDRRVTAVNLAVQLYRADHGRWPERLEELVPPYLASLPADPYHDDGRPLGYVMLRGALPDGGDRPMLYFDVGETKAVPIPDKPTYGWMADGSAGSRRDVRQYRDLSRFVPPPSTQAVEDDPEESDGPGEEAEDGEKPE